MKSMINRIDSKILSNNILDQTYWEMFLYF
jgi:hypothetical protein